MHGWNGCILRVNLTSGAIAKEPLDEAQARMYLGGRALGAKILLEETRAGLDPLGAENTMVWAAGPLSGAPFQGNCRYAVMAKSPLTGLWGESHVAGHWARQFKQAGYDAIIVEGASEKPVYLAIRDDAVEIRDAAALWGQETVEAEAAIRKELDDKTTEVAVIGPAGERLVRFASIMSGRGHAAGRLGMGAVMGSKNLKAVAVRGTGKVRIADPKKLAELAKVGREESMAGFGTPMNAHGTAGGIAFLHEQGRVPTMNFRESEFENITKVVGEEITARMLVKKDACYGCSVACKRIVEAKGRITVDPAYGGPEYETVMAMGPFCKVDDLEAIAKANELCNRYGIDTISTGVAIAFAMECFEKNLITAKDTGGIELTWGSGDAVVAMVEKIAKGEDVGAILGLGTREAARRLGAPESAMQVKGLEIPMHDPRWKKGLSLSYAVAARGGTHLDAPHDDWIEKPSAIVPEIGLGHPLEERDPHRSDRTKVEIVVAAQDFYALIDSLIICKFTTLPGGQMPDTIRDIFCAVTGWDASLDELMSAGRRAVELTRVYLAREGATRDNDTLPARLHEGLPQGPHKGDSVTADELERMKDDYYELRGWDREKGWPTRETLEGLGIGWCADQIPQQ